MLIDVSNLTYSRFTISNLTLKPHIKNGTVFLISGIIGI